jgi:DNA replication protein DnaC
MNGPQGWIEQQREYLGVSNPVMVPCSDPAGIHASAAAARLATISGLLPEELTITLASVIPRSNGSATAEMLDLATRFVRDPWGFFTVWGSYGNGKTLVLQAVVNEMRQRFGHVGTYVRFKDLLDHVRDGNAPDASVDARARYERLKVVPVLAIDELDAARMTDYAREFRTAFLDDRYRMAVTGRAHTLFALNHDPASAVPGDVYDRLRDGRFVIFHNADVSMRPAMERGCQS